MIKQKFSFKCDACGKTETVSYKLIHPTPVYPVFPDDWLMVGEYIFCDRHEIKIDGGRFIRNKGLEK